MNYQFNYSFFESWINANPNIKKQDLLNAIGILSTNGINVWMDRTRPMPILTILKICNSFNIPLGMFFCDADSTVPTHTCIPGHNINMQLEPNGGYRTERKPGKGSTIDPTPTITHLSNIPEPYRSMLRDYEQSLAATVPEASAEGSARSARPATVPAAATVPEASAEGHSPAGATIDLAALLDLERTHAAQRQELLDIIKSQRQQIVELTNKLLRATAPIPEPISEPISATSPISEPSSATSPIPEPSSATSAPPSLSRYGMVAEDDFPL